MDDHELLRRYLRDQSQDAFRELVERHLGMVYGTAQRMVRDAHLAEEVAQNTFATLAQKASAIQPPQVVAGWLYRTARHVALHAVRGEQRRKEREQTAAAMHALHSNTDMNRILEDLEATMDHLEDDERDVLLLRFLENRSFRDVGLELGVSEDAARMRVNRAVERLREAFAQRGFSVASVLLAATLSSGTATAAPAGLAAAITATLFTGTVTTATAVSAIGWLNLKAALAVIGVAAAVGTGTYYVEQQQVNQLRADNQNLMAQRQKLVAANAVATAAAQAREADAKKMQRDAIELARLRAEVAQLLQRRQALAALQSENQRLRQAPTPASSPPPPPPPELKVGTFVPKEQLTFVGYASPEAALQSLTWCMMKGDYDAVMAASSPEIQAAESKDPKSRQSFEELRPQVEKVYKGMQILARKVLSGDRVELKIFADYGKGEVQYQPMAKYGDEWKLSGSTRNFPANWDQNPEQIQTYSP